MSYMIDGLLLRHLGIPFAPTGAMVEGFYTPHADVEFGDVAANDENKEKE